MRVWARYSWSEVGELARSLQSEEGQQALAQEDSTSRILRVEQLRRLQEPPLPRESSPAQLSSQSAAHEAAQKLRASWHRAQVRDADPSLNTSSPQRHRELPSRSVESASHNDSPWIQLRDHFIQQYERSRASAEGDEAK